MGKAMAMDLHELRVFLAVWEQGGVTAAARQLHCVQSNVTARLQALESSLGTPLFYRRARGMVPTPAAEKLQGYARRMLHLAELAHQAVQPAAQPEGSLVLGSMETTAAIRLPPVLADFHLAHPGVEIRLHTGTSAELRREVLEYRLEGALVGGELDHPELAQEVLFAEEMVLVAPAGCTGLEDERIRALIGFRQGCSYQARLDAWMRELGRPPLRLMEFGSLEAILGCVAAGMGVSLMPRAVVEHRDYGRGLRQLPVPERLARVNTCFIRRQDMPPSAALQALLARLGGGHGAVRS